MKFKARELRRQRVLISCVSSRLLMLQVTRDPTLAPSARCPFVIPYHCLPLAVVGHWQLPTGCLADQLVSLVGCMFLLSGGV